MVLRMPLQNKRNFSSLILSNTTLTWCCWYGPVTWMQHLGWITHLWTRRKRGALGGHKTPHRVEEVHQQGDPCVSQPMTPAEGDQVLGTEGPEGGKGIWCVPHLLLYVINGIFPQSSDLNSCPTPFFRLQMVGQLLEHCLAKGTEYIHPPPLIPVIEKFQCWVNIKAISMVHVIIYDNFFMEFMVCLPWFSIHIYFSSSQLLRNYFWD